jgi:hypothetical protein
VAEKEVRIVGSKSELPQTLFAAAGEETVDGGVRNSVLKWRALPKTLRTMCSKY